MFILNEDFSGTSGTTPPSGWTTTVFSGTSEDLWHFDNPGNRQLNYPFTEPFAIFDSDSTSANGQPEEVALETSLFDASTSNFILLNFVHVLDPGLRGEVRIEVYDGNEWQQVATFFQETDNPEAEIVDLSAYAGGITNARLRFIWVGDGAGFWALDNIRIYASLPLDGGIVSLDSPVSPVSPGIQNVSITLGNFGYNTLNSTTINWTADGVVQPSFPWTGSIGFGQTLSNIVIGTYNFQDPVTLTIWQSNPNGQTDLNVFNDTITQYLVSPLCGNYTIGGANADFDSFSQVAQVLNTAGITCPVTFLLRDGTYYEQFELKDIPGSSEINTVVFRSESGDSSKALIRIIPGALKYESMVYLNGTRHVRFENIGLVTGSGVSFYNNAIQMNNARDISFENCYFEIRNQNDFAVMISGGSRDISIARNRFESISGRAGAIDISGALTRQVSIQDNFIKGPMEWEYASVQVTGLASVVDISANHFERSFWGVFLEDTDSIIVRGNTMDNINEAVCLEDQCSSIEISANRLSNIKSHQNVPGGTSGIFVKNSTGIDIFNNFIHTTGQGTVMCITLQNSTGCRVAFNSTNTTNTDAQAASKGLYLTGNSQAISRNNIFRVKHSGTPVYVDDPTPQLDSDRNNYHSPFKLIGNFNGTEYFSLEDWSSATGLDNNSLSEVPFYTSETDLSFNQSLLNNAGIPLTGITIDIDGTPRNPATPDIGAKEYNPCQPDAGINEITGPVNPLDGGVQDVTVLLQNHGSAALTGAVINWTVNGTTQTSYPWNGNLASGANTNVTIGNYNFQPGVLYVIRAWTSNPNNSSDCNFLNDTITGRELAVPLCGDYTIGGNDPDFATFTEAVNFINISGVTCPVNFNVRDGIYQEQLVIRTIPGSSPANTVTFTSESGDSTKAVLKIKPDAQKYTSMVYMDGTENVGFTKLGLYTGTDLNFLNNAVFMVNCGNILFENCNFRLLKESDISIVIEELCRDITVKDNNFESFNTKAVAVDVSGPSTRAISILDNKVIGATEWGVATMRFDEQARAIQITGNVFENCFRALYFLDADTVQVQGNNIKNCNEGIIIDNGCSHYVISANRISDLKSHANAQDGTNGISLNNTTQTDIFNNFIHSSGNGPVTGINIMNSTLSRVNFNSINITNVDVQSKSRGLNIKTCTSITSGNNVVVVVNTGTPVSINGNLTLFSFDRNDYYGPGKLIGQLNGNNHFSLGSWQSATGFDQNSLNVLPFFNSATDLSINQVLLNNAGSPVPGILTDIDGTIRDAAQPDIGAREYTPCGNDAGINEITAPANPLAGGPEEVRVKLQNQGTSSLTSVTINWKINDDLQAPYSWSGNLPVKGNTEVTPGTYDFSGDDTYVIQVWTTQPNNVNDCNNRNDTITSPEYSGPLCGTYTIGGDNPDFLSFSQVAEVLNTSGITCPVEFLVRDGDYFDKFIINGIEGSSAENTITFRSESGDSSKAVLHLEEGSLNFESMILLTDTRHIRFKNLGFMTGTSESIANIVFLLEGCTDVTIDHCLIRTTEENDIGINVTEGSKNLLISRNRFDCTHPKASALNITDEQNRDIQFLENEILGSSNWGNTLIKTGSFVRNLAIEGNYFDRSFRTIYTINSDSVFIRNNTIKNTNSGIYIDNQCTQVEISANRLIHVQSYANLPEGTSGVYILNSNRVDLINNFIQTGGGGPVLAVNLQGVENIRLVYNSLNITNTDPQGKSKGFYIVGCDTILGRNNICQVNNYGTPIHLGSGISSLNLDYNNYYQKDGIIGIANNVTFTSLFDWGQNIQGDANSLNVNSIFKADSIPLPYQKTLNGAGINVAGLQFDIDGKLRHPQAPDIGCLEFFIDFGVLELLSPTLDCYHPDVDSVKVYVRQFGDVPFDNLKIAYKIDEVGITHMETVDGPINFDFIHTFLTTETISAPGDYTFRIWLEGNTDDNINNDVLVAKRYSKPPPTVTIEYDNECTGWEVQFLGSATVESPYFVSNYEWFFGDGDTASVQNPVHEYLAAGTYEVILRAYSNAGCYSEKRETIVMDPDFQGLRLDIDKQDEICIGDGSGSLTLTGSGGTPPYKYYINGSLLDDPIVSNLQPGTYAIMMEDANQCSRTDTVESTVLVNMDARITAIPLTGLAPLTVAFEFTANGADTWTWYFPGDITDTSRTTEFTFAEYGYYTVILETNSGEPYYCIDTDSVEIFADIIITIDANTVFSPNDDGNNDFFEIRSSGVESLEAHIFNQWGNEVYEISEVDGKWDGKMKNGKEAPDGTYFWSINAKGINGREYNKEGSVLLLRHGAVAMPNPVSGNVRILVYETLQAPVTVSVFSVFGDLAHREQINDTGNISLDISHLAGGIYIIRIDDGERSSYVRIIKK